MTPEELDAFTEGCRQWQIKVGTYHPELEAILPVLDWRDPANVMVHNNAAVHGYILRERERCAKIADSFFGLVSLIGPLFGAGMNEAATRIAAAIRSGERVNEPPASFVSSESKL